MVLKSEDFTNIGTSKSVKFDHIY